MLSHLPGMNSSLTPLWASSFWRRGLSSSRSRELSKAPGATEGVRNPSATSPRLERSKKVLKLLTRDSLETQRQGQPIRLQNPPHILSGNPQPLPFPLVPVFILSVSSALRVHKIQQGGQSIRQPHTILVMTSLLPPALEKKNQTQKPKTNPTPRSCIIVALLFMDLKSYSFMNFNVQSIFFPLILH